MADHVDTAAREAIIRLAERMDREDNVWCNQLAAECRGILDGSIKIVPGARMPPDCNMPLSTPSPEKAQEGKNKLFDGLSASLNAPNPEAGEQRVQGNEEWRTMLDFAPGLNNRMRVQSYCGQHELCTDGFDTPSWTTPLNGGSFTPYELARVWLKIPPPPGVCTKYQASPSPAPPQPAEPKVLPYRWFRDKTAHNRVWRFDSNNYGRYSTAGSNGIAGEYGGEPSVYTLGQLTSLNWIEEFSPPTPTPTPKGAEWLPQGMSSAWDFAEYLLSQNDDYPPVLARDTQWRNYITELQSRLYKAEKELAVKGETR